MNLKPAVRYPKNFSSYFIPVVVWIFVSVIVIEDAYAQPEVKTEATTDTTSKNTDEIFSIVEVMPEFPGGQTALMDYLSKNIKYPKKARKENTTGTVFVQFVVDVDGKVIDTKILRGVSEEIDAVALDVISNMPVWSPGVQDGKFVKVLYNIPIRFTLRDP